MMGRKAEEQANAFASAFLMPEAAVKARTPRSPSLRSIMECKETWGVSAVAFCFRLHKLEMLTDWYYQQLMRKLSVLGYRTAEKHSRPRETSQVLRKVLDELRANGTTKNEVARLLDIDPAELDRLVFGLVMTGLPGGGDDPATPGERKHTLRLV
jgi:Zn-dependent peptidase ImmA (M78 family)